MFNEILKITPKLDAAALSQMERTLSSRFGRVAKSFGKGVVGALKGGGIVGVGLSLIDKLLNPLEETRNAIDKTLGRADDVVTNAEQFSTTPGKLFRLQTMAQAKGLDPDALNTLLVKYQGAIAEAKADPTKQTSVRNYANDTDIAESFFQFIQSMRQLDPKKQTLVQNEVFGEKQTLKMAEFLRADFEGLNKRLGLKTAAEYDPRLQNLDRLEDKQSEGLAAQEAASVYKRGGGLINDNMINARLNAQKIEKQREDERIANFKNLQAINDTSMKIQGLVEKGVNLLGELIVKVTPAVNALVGKVEAVSKSGLIRGIFGSSGKEKDK